MKLLVYTDRSNWNAGTHAFNLHPADPEPMLTAQCSSGGGGNCLPDMTAKPVPYADAALLQGAFECPASDFFAGVSARWVFTAD